MDLNNKQKRAIGVIGLSILFVGAAITGVLNKENDKPTIEHNGPCNGGILLTDIIKDRFGEVGAIATQANQVGQVRKQSIPISPEFNLYFSAYFKPEEYVIMNTYEMEVGQWIHSVSSYPEVTELKVTLKDKAFNDVKIIEDKHTERTNQPIEICKEAHKDTDASELTYSFYMRGQRK